MVIHAPVRVVRVYVGCLVHALLAGCVARAAGDAELRDAARGIPSDFRPLRDIVNERLRAIEGQL